jgi:AcrR family transcriptional regulator
MYGLIQKGIEMAERGRPRSFERTAALRRAMEVFWAKGYDSASLADLTAAMGINAPSLYAAFGCKEALFREAVALYGATEGTEIWDALPQAPAREAIERFLRASALSFTRPDRPAGCLVVLGALLANDANARVCGELRASRAGNVAALRARLARAVGEGELPASLDCEAVATFYATVQQGMSIQARDGASRATLLAVADCAMAAWDGMVAPALRTSRGSSRARSPRPAPAARRRSPP